MSPDVEACRQETGVSSAPCRVCLFPACSTWPGRGGACRAIVPTGGREAGARGGATNGETLHFISALPRSGSTLLAAILRQNPAFHAAMTSPVGSLYMALEGAMSRRNEASVFLDAGQRRALLRGVFAGYYHAIAAATVVFDTNRLWCARLPALVELFPRSRVICCVRDVPWIMDSIERQAIRNPFEPSGLFGYETGGTVYSRVARVAAPDGMVGYALNALREACFDRTGTG